MTAAPRPEMPATGSRRAVQRFLVDRPYLTLSAILVLLLLGTEIASPGYVTLHQLSSTLLSAAPLGLLAAGQTLVMLTGGIDLAVAATATGAAYLVAAYGGQGVVPAVVVALVFGALIGLINGVGIGIFNVQPLIMTLGLSGVITGGLTLASLSFTNGAPVIPDAVHSLGSTTVWSYLPLDLLLWAPLAALIVYGLRSSGLGRTIYAVGDNPLACRLAGIRVWQVLLATYMLCGVLAALAGIVLVGYTNAADLNLATPYLLQSVAAVVIGGTSILGGSGGYSGTILGALILTVLDALLTILNVSQAAKQLLYGAIVLALASIYARTTGGE